jgi:glycine betaine catabolism A
MAKFYAASDTLVPGSTTLPGRYYTTQEIYQAELERIFYERWLVAGRGEQIPRTGDYFLTTIGAESLIILRNPQGGVNAFYNVCRHRGTRLCTDGTGRFSHSIQCPYHAWTYGLDGRLIGAPQMDDTPGFDASAYPLHAAGLAEWEGFLLVNLAQQPAPFAEAFAPLIGKFSAWELPNLRVARRATYQVKANWKLILQNYSECYHCPLIHPDLARKSPSRSGRNDLFEGPFLGGYCELNPGFDSLTLSGRACALPLARLEGEDMERIYYYAIFPNTLLSLHPDYVMCHTLWPQGPGETFIICEWLFTPQAIAAPGFNPDDAAGFWDMTNRQDWHACELSQLGVASRAYTPGPYSGSESLLAAFDREVLRSLA